MNKNLVSVIMPTYNRGYVISRAIDSILSQTHGNFELIIIDDCSTDNTEEIVRKYDDNRIIYIKLDKNCGANFARNEGIKRASGNYITFQDSDDCSYDDRLEIELKTLNEKKVDWVFTSFMKVDGKKKKIVPKKQIMSDEIEQKLLYGNFVTTQVLFAKRKVFDDIKFDDSLPRFQDWDLVIRMAKKYKGYHISDVYLNMYLQNDSITKNPSKGFNALKMMLDKYENELNNEQKAKIYCRIGLFGMLSNIEVDEYFRKCLSLDCKVLYLMIYVLYKIKLMKMIYKLVRR